VEGIENNGNQYGLKDTSRSNIICLQQLETVYLPNAFTPDGRNPIFLPVGTFLKDTDYYFGIFNRWGQELYATNKSGEGWDGTYKGEPCQEDVYAYVLRYKTNKGKNAKKLGGVLLLR
jgi:gliding motility-associated-like protein